MRSWQIAGLGVVFAVLAVLIYSSAHGARPAPAGTKPPPAQSAVHVPAVPAKAPAFVPSRMAAIGDSVSEGFLTCWNKTCPANSWSTGTAVDSHYQRIRAINPKMTGHARNFSRLGAFSWDLVSQAKQAVAYKAQYVTVLIGANDACTADLKDMTSVRNFRNGIAAALDTLKAGLPDARILVVSIPDIYRLWQLGRNDSLAIASWTVFPGCRSMLARPTSTATADNQRRQRVAAQIRAYDRELAGACRDYGTHCRTDHGAVHQVPFTMDLVNPVDHFHPNVKGQNRLAAVTYPPNFDW